MSKVVTNFTTDLDFRRAINAAGGSLKIDSTPEQVVNSLRSIGGAASFGSPFETILNIVNEGDTPTIDRDIYYIVYGEEGAFSEYTGKFNSAADVITAIQSNDVDSIRAGFSDTGPDGEEANLVGKEYTFVYKCTNDSFGGSFVVNEDLRDWSLYTKFGDFHMYLDDHEEVPVIVIEEVTEYQVDFNKFLTHQEMEREESISDVVIRDKNGAKTFIESINIMHIAAGFEQTLTDHEVGSRLTFSMEGSESSLTGTLVFTGDEEQDIMQLELTTKYGIYTIDLLGMDTQTPYFVVTRIGPDDDPEPSGSFQIKLASGLTDYDVDSPMPYIRVTNTSLEYPSEYWNSSSKEDGTLFHRLTNSEVVSITLNNNVHLRDLVVYDKYGTAGIENNVRFFFDETEVEAINAMFEQYPGFIGVPMSIHVNEGVFIRAGKTSSEFNFNGRFGTSVPPTYTDETTDSSLVFSTVAEGTIFNSESDEFNNFNSLMRDLDGRFPSAGGKAGIDTTITVVADGRRYIGTITDGVYDESTNHHKLVVENEGRRLAISEYTEDDLDISSSSNLIVRIDDLYEVPLPEYEEDLIIDVHDVPNTAEGYKLDEKYEVVIPDGESLEPIRSIYEQLFIACADMEEKRLVPEKFSEITARFITPNVDLVAVRSKVNPTSPNEGTFYSESDFPYKLNISENIVPIINEEDLSVTVNKTDDQPVSYTITKEYTSN